MGPRRRGLKQGTRDPIPGHGELPRQRHAWSHILQNAQPRRLRTRPHARRSCGMINTSNVSAEPDQAHNPIRKEPAACRQTSGLGSSSERRNGLLLLRDLGLSYACFVTGLCRVATIGSN